MNRFPTNHDTLRPRWLVARAIVWALLVVFPASNSTAQNRPNARNLGAPSPAEMLVRLQYRKQQETPLFDLLRNSGRDIFSKLGDDERKFAERFAEDLIQKRGVDSDEVKELMDRMNVGPEIQKAIGESLKDADLDKLKRQLEDRQKSGAASGSQSNFNLERFKERLEKVRQQQVRNKFSKNDQRNNANSASPPNSSTANPNFNGSENNPTANNDSRRSNTNNAANQSSDNAATNPRGDNSDPTAPNRSARNRRRPQLGDAPVIEGDPDNVFGDQGFTPESNVEDRPASSNRPDARRNEFSDSSTASRPSPLLDSAQRQVVEKLQSAITPNTSSGRETRKGLEQLKQAKDPADFLNQLSDLAKQVETDKRKQQLLENAAKSLSASDENTIQSFVEPFSPELAKSLRSSNSKSEATNRESAGNGSAGSGGDGSSSTKPEDWAQSEFLKKAISYYNDEESGFQKPKGFDRLLNDKSTRRGGTTMNFEAAKKLWSQSSDIFEDKISDSGKSKKVKPGQRIDQSVIEAIKKVSSIDSDSSPEQKSMFTNALNGLIGTALGKAEDSAKKKIERQRERQRARDDSGWPQGNDRQFSQNPRDNQNSMAQAFQNLGSTASRKNDQQNSSSPSATPSLPTLPDVGSSIGPIVYVLVAILVVGAIAYLTVRLLKPIDEIAKKEKQLQQRLQSGATAKPGEIVEAVDLLLLTKFGSVSSWWNSCRAAEKLQTAKPDWHDKIGSVFQVYRWSRYQASDESTIPAEQKSIVTSVLKDLAEQPESAFRPTASDASQVPDADSETNLESTNSGTGDRSKATS